MSDTKHPVLELLAYTDMSVFLNLDNFKLFLKIKEAVQLDGKSLNISGEELNGGFEESLRGTVDLHDEQPNVLGRMIAAWAASITTPMIKALNKYSQVATVDDYYAEVGHYYSGGINNGQLFFEHFDAFINNMKPDDAKNVLAVLDDWSHTVELFVNAAEFKSALQSVAT